MRGGGGSAARSCAALPTAHARNIRARNCMPEIAGSFIDSPLRMLRKWYGCHLEWDERQITGVRLILTADAVVQHDDTAFESFTAGQVQRHRTMPSRHQR